MNMKNPLALAVVIAAANMVTAQEVPATSHISERILATNRPNANGNYPGWPTLPNSDILWRKRIWRNIDVKDKANWVFRQETEQSLLNTLVAGVTSGRIKAYRDDMFANELSAEELAMRMKMIGNNKATDGSDGVLISKYQLKEDSLSLTHDGQTEVRIVGIAPMVEQVSANGETFNLPMCWIYYIDALNYLAESPAPGKAGFTWADILQSRSFYGNTVSEKTKMFNSRPDSLQLPVNKQ